MFVTDDMIRQMEEAYGTPAVRRFDVPATPEEIRRIASTQKHGRNHDVTIYVHKDDQWIVIAKHPYPPGLYRAPSGGIHPGETILAGIHREVAEELGCEIELERFLLRTEVRFYADPTAAFDEKIIFPSVATESPSHDIKEIHWRSWVFLARYVSGELNFTDAHEIREVRLADWDEFAGFSTIMRRVGHGGLRYRAALHDAVAELLGKS